MKFTVHAGLSLAQECNFANSADSPENPSEDRILKIPLLRVAEFRAGRYGKLSFTPELLQELADNFNAQSVGYDISINVQHRPELGAVAWVEQVAVDGKQLIVYARPTSEGRRLVEDKTYRYASAEIDMAFTDRESGKKVGAVLTGAALTNNPYIHRQDSVALLSNDAGLTAIDIPDDDEAAEPRVGGGNVESVVYSDAVRKAAVTQKALRLLSRGGR